MRIGKLTPTELKECVLGIIKKRRNEVLQSACIGSDSAELKVDGTILMTVDPITGGSTDCGSLAVNISCNDIAASGGEPIAALLSILAPKDASAEDIKRVMQDAELAAQSLNVEIVGGHTEFTDAVNRIVVNATVIGVKSKNVVFSDMAPGDSIIVTKELGLEGTSIIAADYADSNLLSLEEMRQARDCIKSISVVKESLVCEKVSVSAVHDITEGGVYGALCEVMENNAFGAVVYPDKIPFRSITEKLCDIYNIDKFRLLSSGSMLFITSQPQKLMDELSKLDIRATVIGEITQEVGVYALMGNKKEKLAVTRDELGKVGKMEIEE